MTRLTSRKGAVCGAILLLCSGGCVERTLRLESDPPGALVSLNGEEIARTPATVPLVWYGRYDVAARLEGRETLKQKRWVVAPWWQWPPLDLAAELLPVRLTDRRTLRLDLPPAEAATTDPEAMVGRARTLREELPATRR